MSKQTAEQIRQLAIDFYGDDPHLYGGQRDGYQVGYTAAMHQYASPGWIKASERLPESDDECAVKLWFSPSKFVYDTAYYRGGVWYNCNTDNPIARDGLNPFKLEWLSESPAKPEGEGKPTYSINMNTKAYDVQIEGEGLLYSDIGTHYGAQCNYSGDDPKHGLIEGKLKEVAELMKDIHELNKL